MAPTDALRLNRRIDRTTQSLIVAFWVGIALLFWVTSPFESFPTPMEVAAAFSTLWWQDGLGPELATTIKLILHALFWTVVISLSLSYLTVVPFFRPVVLSLGKLRFLGLTGLVFPFTLVTGGGYSLKVWLLTFGMSSFFITSMAQIVAEIPSEQFDHMRVLGASELRIAWEVVIRGTLDKALEVLRQNLAMGWSMITMVEGISRSEGGIGALILNQNKHFHLPEVYAILLLILAVGLLLDYGMGVLTNLLCPYVQLERVRR